MDLWTEIQAADAAFLQPVLVAEALNTLYGLLSTADQDIYTDAPECRVSVSQIQDTIQQGYDLLQRIYTTLEAAKQAKPLSPEQTRAKGWRMLQEGEEAFAVMSMVEERAYFDGYEWPITIEEYIYWIEDEARIEAENPEEDDGEQESYIRALRGLAGELREMGFAPLKAVKKKGEKEEIVGKSVR